MGKIAMKCMVAMADTMLEVSIMRKLKELVHLVFFLTNLQRQAILESAFFHLFIIQQESIFKKDILYRLETVMV